MSRMTTATAALAVMALVGLFQPCDAFAASTVLLEASRLVKSADGLADTAPDEAGNMYRKAFQAALSLTTPASGKRQREEALALATRCIHPDLFQELRIAIDTYLSLYPRGRHACDVQMRKALIEYADGNPAEAEAALTAAKSLARGAKRVKLEALQLDGHLTAHMYRSAETALSEMPTRNRTIRRDKKRFKKGSELVAEALDQVRDGKLTGDSAIRALDEAIEAGYFGAAAPAAEMELSTALDRKQPAYHRCEVNFMDQVREHRHHLAPNQRLDRMVAFLNEYPQADEELRGRAMFQAAAVCRYELRDAARAATFMEELQSLETWKERVAIERLLDVMTPENLDKAEFRSAVRTLIIDHAKSFPYDNGILPVVTIDVLTELDALSATITEAKSDLGSLLETFKSTLTVRGIPMQAIYLAACDNRMRAWEEIENAGKSVDEREKKMMSDILRPFFLMTSPTDRLLISALALYDRFPIKAVDSLLVYLTKRPDSLKSQHALALLADLYKQHGDYIEAQSVWSTLRKFYPKSLWTK
ncbi:hypothetical protein KBA41_17775 [Candidatus Ozemobacteraceae bacterium]|nr:hypothetical protein [Candidatus Ozemobacteraceae bacterium]